MFFSRLSVSVAIVCQFVNAALGQQTVPSLGCAAVVHIECSDPLGKKSKGFRIRNNCGIPLRYQYQTHHKEENKTYQITNGIANNQFQKSCGLTSNAEHEFLRWVFLKGDVAGADLLRREAEIPKRDADLRRMVGDIEYPKRPNRDITIKLIERSIDLEFLPLPTLSDYTENARRAWNQLKEMRSDKENPWVAQVIPLRDAENYALGLYAGLNDDPIMGTILSKAIDWNVYDLRKQVYVFLGLDPPRSDPDIPASPPGGTEWAQAGVGDGRFIKANWNGIANVKQFKFNYPSVGHK